MKEEGNSKPAVFVLGIVLIIVSVGSGCAMTWGASQIGQGKPPFDENARSETVPLPGVLEALNVRVHFAGRPRAPQTVAQSRSTQPVQAPPLPTPLTAGETELVLDCQVVQSGQEKVYRAATRYGKTWKYGTAAMFVIEGALAAALILSEESKPQHVIGGWLLAADAVGTGALFFVPSRDVYENKVQPTLTPVRSDCPEGLTLEMAGRGIPVDAAGKIGPVGAVLLKEHMERHNTPVRVRLGEVVTDVFVSAEDRCTWAQRTQHPGIANFCNLSGGLAGRMSADVTMAVPLGSLIGPSK